MATSLPCIHVSFESVDQLRQEYARTIRKGGVFAPGAEPLPDRCECTLVLAHPDTAGRFELRAEVVYVKPEDPGRGVGVHLLDFNPTTIAALEAFIESASDPAHSPPAELAPPPPDLHAPGPVADPSGTAAPDAHGDEPVARLAVSALHERLRGLTLAEQMRLAREGGLQERVALERLFGKAVWEPILQNQRVSPPEVARIARMGTAPTPLLEMIAGNAAWLSSGEVRRALLSNPRLSEEGVTKVLRHAPKPELQLVASQTLYASRVRKIARTLLNR